MLHLCINTIECVLSPGSLLELLSRYRPCLSSQFQPFERSRMCRRNLQVHGYSLFKWVGLPHLVNDLRTWRGWNTVKGYIYKPCLYQKLNGEIILVSMLRWAEIRKCLAHGKSWSRNFARADSATIHGTIYVLEKSRWNKHSCWMFTSKCFQNGSLHNVPYHSTAWNTNIP